MRRDSVVTAHDVAVIDRLKGRIFGKISRPRSHVENTSGPEMSKVSRRISPLVIGVGYPLIVPDQTDCIQPGTTWPPAIKRILVLRAGHIGDVVLLTPAL